MSVANDIYLRMSAAAAQRTIGYALMLAAVLAYFARPWSCSSALSQFAQNDAKTYAEFDRHGFGAMSAWLSALLLAVPMIWLGSMIFLNSTAKLSIFGRTKDVNTTAWSIAIASGLAAPTLAQMSYLNRLPMSVSMPILLSCLAWLLVVEVGRTAAINGDLLNDRAVGVAATIALMTALPKFVLGAALLNR